MAGIIVLENNAGKASLERALQATLEQSQETPVLICQEAPSLPVAAEKYTVLAGTTVSEAAHSASALLKEDTVIFIDARLNLSSEQLSTLISQANAMTETIALVSLESNGKSVESGDLTPEALVPSITSEISWPTSVFAVKRSFLQQTASIEASSANEFLVKLLLEAISHGASICTQLCDLQFGAEQAELLEETSKLSKSENAKCLRHSVAIFNIEELFPNHSWELHGNESAAACYHTLSALFIRFEDVESALECLGLSDQLEDSPRSLALKGLIAISKGETLEAVANMVSSLQEYERRKVSTESKHYLKFVPQNLEVINSKLQSGLTALNERDNEVALGHFADAVFNFDSFYEDVGLQGLKGRMN